MGYGSGMGKQDKAGTYRLMMEMNIQELPDFCKDGCIYTKDRDVKNTKYCFRRSASYAAECDAEGGHGGYGGEFPRPVYDCHEEDMAYTQPQEPKEEPAERWSDCQEMCSFEEKCNFWSFNERARTCLMMKAFGSEERETGTTSGPKKCLIYDCQEEGTAYGQPEGLKVERFVEKWSDCQKMCMKDEKCNFWTFDEKDETCQMMESFGLEEKKQGSISGVKKCPIYDCQNEATTYERPAGSEEFQRVENWSECQKMCRDDERCKFWTFDEREQTCTTMSDFANEAPKQGSISGPKRCPVYDCQEEGVGVEAMSAIDPVEERFIDSWSDCQKMCRDDEKCNHWSYNVKEKTCMKMRAKMRTMRAEGFFSGPKECTKRNQ